MKLDGSSKLYIHIPETRRYVDTGHTVDDYDKLEAENQRLTANNTESIYIGLLPFFAEYIQEITAELGISTYQTLKEATDLWLDSMDIDYTTYSNVIHSQQKLETENQKLKDANRWIPVSERLPTNERYYLVTTGVFETEISGFGSTQFEHPSVIAWREIPEPYQWDV